MSLADPGAIPDVVAGAVADPDWGNAIRDRVHHHFASAAARDAAIPSPTEGMSCWLADVDQYLVYNGVAWRMPWGLPWGCVGAVSDSSGTQSGISAEVDVTNLTITWTAVANRKYKATAAMQITCNTGATRPFIKIKTSAGTILQQSLNQELTGAVILSLDIVYYATGVAAGSTTWKVSAVTNANTIDIAGGSSTPRTFIIEDVGPNGVAA